MKHYIFISIALAILTSCASTQPRYTPAETPVNGCYQDYARQLSDSTAKEIASLCTTLLNKSQLNLAVVTVPGLGPLSVESYAEVLAEQWAKADPSAINAVLVLLAFHDRKMRIELSGAAGQRMSDPQAKQIIDLQFIPLFRQSKLDAGTIRGVRAIVSWFASH